MLYTAKLPLSGISHNFSGKGIASNPAGQYKGSQLTNETSFPKRRAEKTKVKYLNMFINKDNECGSWESTKNLG